MNFEITLFGRINWTEHGLKTIKVQDAITIIRDGDYYIEDTCLGIYDSLKNITFLMQHLPDEKHLQSAKKQLLPAVSFNGVYNNGIVKYSNVTAMDFDHIPSQKEYTDLYMRLMATPCVGWVYRTPSGRGLKALVLHDNVDPGMHDNMYQQLMHMFQTPYIKTDPRCRDLSRRNYLCYDPDVWTNPSPVPYHFTYDAAFDVKASSYHAHTTKQKQPIINREKPMIAVGLPSDASVMNMLKSRCKRFHPDYLIEGARRDGAYWFGTQASKAGVDFTYGLEYVQELYKSNEITLTRGGEFSEEEVEENYTNGYDTETYNEEYRKGFKIKRQRL